MRKIPFKLSKLNKGSPEKRCMTCLYWYPVTEDTGRCTLSKSKMFTLPNYVCKRWKYWRSKN